MMLQTSSKSGKTLINRLVHHYLYSSISLPIYRLENELIVRARLAKEYETKEAARRLADWEKRGLWTSELPPPNVPLVE